MNRVAIVGIGCRYAGGIDSGQSFWDFVLNKSDGVIDMPADRWDYRRFYDPDTRAAGRMYTKRGAFLDCDPWQFDSDFFGVSPREATGLDPQQRLLMEVAWEALDDAGMAGRLSGRQVGVYVGGFTSDHALSGAGDLALAHCDMHTAGSASFTMLSNRLAFALNLTGPAMTIDTACSSSLVALHLACQGIATDDCDMALVGGVNVMTRPETFIMMCKGGFLAPDGRCKSFSASADGYGRGEGVGMVVLRKLDDALRDGDRIYAVVEATGSNQDGRTPSITVPNVDSQEALARSVCRRSGIAPSQVTYVEAHGTGTAVGDPVELVALGRVYGAVDGREKPLPVGSLKATLGHTEAASGVAGVIKGALATYYRTLPPQGWFGEPNPEIPFEELRVAIQTEPREVGADVERMAVAINGFGYGGTNAHAVIAEPPRNETKLTPPSQSHCSGIKVFPLSGRCEAAARDLAGAYAELLAQHPDPEHLVEAAWTRRAHHRHRAGIVYSDHSQLVDKLREIASEATPIGSVVSRSAGPVFVFTGMGPQWWAMGRDLLNAGGTFASEAADIDKVFQEIAGWSIIEELKRPEDESRVTSTVIAQPANFLIQVALARELAEYGIMPSAMVGHSVGEVSAAYLSGMLSLSDALLVSYHRSRLQATTAGTGGMLAIGLPADDVRPLIGDDAQIDIAAINSPSSVTVAGDVRELESLAQTLNDRGVFNRLLRVEVPYHSRLMDPILDELRSELACLAPQPPKLPLHSTVTGEVVTDSLWDADYWCANVREPVRFADATTALVKTGHRIYVEIGPRPVLSANIREILLTNGDSGAAIPTLNNDRPDTESIQETIAGLYAAGGLHIEAIFGEPVAHLDLPRYPWQRQYMRIESPEMRQYLYGTPGSHSLLGDPDSDFKYAWELRVSEQTLPWLADHVVDGRCILPGAGYLDAALSAASMHMGVGSVALQDVRFVSPLVVDAADSAIMRTELDETTRKVTIRSRPSASTVWTVHATGRVLEGIYKAIKHPVPDTSDMTGLDIEEFYRTLADRGLVYGPNFQRVRSVHYSIEQAVATVHVGRSTDTAKHIAHPCVVDAALQTAAALIDLAIGRAHGSLVPIGVEEVRFFVPLPEEVTVVAQRHPEDPLRVDIVIVDAENVACAQLLGVQCGSINPGRGPLDQIDQDFYEEVWDLVDPLDIAALPPSEQTATLVVALGDRPGPRARQLADVLPHASYYDCTGAITHANLEADLLQQLRKMPQELPRHHVCVVAGDTTDDITALWTLKHLAITVDKFLAERLGDRVAPISQYGEDTFYVSLVTEGAFAHPEDVAQPNPRHAALAGARRVLAGEQLRLRWRLVDIDPGIVLTELLAELAVPGAFTPGNPDEVLLRNSLRWTPVIRRTLPQRLEAMDKAEALSDPEANCTLDIPKSHLLADLGWRSCRRRAPGPGQVELQMLTVGLGYKDAVKALGLVGEKELGGSHFRGELGMEGVGLVTRVGPDITSLRVGDIAATFARGMLTRYLTTDAALCVTLPTSEADSQTLRPEHCSSTAAFATAEYSLVNMAQLQPGETVLIHGAAGGVGLAAIQVAKACGATIIGTARTDERRAYALEMGADHMMDSRSLNFVEDVRELTDGRGADVVITSAPQLEVLRQSLAAVAEPGRIVEIGKPGIYTGGVLEMMLFEKNVNYFSIDLDRMIRYNPGEFIAIADAVHRKFTEGAYQPLPVHVFDTADVGRAAEEAFRAGRIGRIAVRINDDAVPVKPGWRDVEIDTNGSYLITGGYGAFGLATGRWLVRRGARRLILTGRSGATTDFARDWLAFWRKSGIEVVEERVDVTDTDAVQALINRSHTEQHPLRGIFHSAGAVEDQLVPDLELAALKRTYEAKVHGAEALWSAVSAAKITLDHFALYSSGGSTLGLMGQYSYTAANLAVQSVADKMVREGQPAICIGWGRMSGIGGGMASNDNATRFLDAVGFEAIDLDDGPIYLQEAMRLGVKQAAIIPINWSKLTSVVPFVQRMSRTAPLVAAAAEADSTEDRLRATLIALDEPQRATMVAGMLAQHVAAVMGVSTESIDIDVPVTELGLDSLMAVEFNARASRELGGVQLTSLPFGRVFDLRQAGAYFAEIIVSERGAAG